MTANPYTHHFDIDPHDTAMLHREWLLTNGAGGYAMGSVGGMNRRRYHALFVAATNPPVGRIVALNQMLEKLIVYNGPTYEFNSAVFLDDQGREVHAPAGHEHLVKFEKGLSAVWHARAGNIHWRRELFVHWREQAITLEYRIHNLAAPATVQLGPMLTLRDFHSLCTQSDGNLFNVQPGDGSVMISRGDVAVTAACDKGAFEHQPNWWYNFHYPCEAFRGQDSRENCFVPGYFDLALEPADEHVFHVTVTLDDRPAEPEADTRRRAAHLAPQLRHVQAHEPADRMLVMAADDFVVQRRLNEEKLSTILAGYPWFADWGRDTFIALPGILLATGRFDEARDTLRVFAESIRGGLVPNRFDDYDDEAAHYNTVDASLWFIHAALEYTHQADDPDAWDGWLAASVIDVIEAYTQGTDYNIHMAEDGLIVAGHARTQLTWMDAAAGGVVFTPRHGKAVEINALWYHILLGAAELMRHEDAGLADQYQSLAQQVKRSFRKVFWNDVLGYCNDHVVDHDGEGSPHVDMSLRPNQVLAASLPHSPLPKNMQRKMLKAVTDQLATPMGLRTLPRDDPNYHGRYIGSAFDRDRAYHQGCVWPWLVGPYAEAILRAGNFKAAAIAQASAAIDPLIAFLKTTGVGQLNEIHEGDPPHHPAGCIAQAWSVAEVLRVRQMIKNLD